MRVLITGLCGFIGHHVAEHLLEATDWELVGLDRIDATSTLHRLRHLECWPECGKRVTFVWHDLRAPINTTVDRQLGEVDAVLHLAASTHVDRSITEPLMFVHDNVLGTAHLLEWWRERVRIVKRTTFMMEDERAADPFFLYYGTDEVFGPAEVGQNFKEWDRYRSTNPYSASKAGGEELTCAYSNTYNLSACATHCMNIIGERQHPEKFIPMTIRKILNGELVTIHADATGKTASSRFYTYVGNIGPALKWIIDDAATQSRFEKWNLVGEREIDNLELCQHIARIVGKPLKYELVSFAMSRPGHDFRYSLDGAKLKEAGFAYPYTFEQGIERTVKWFLDHRDWLEG